MTLADLKNKKIAVVGLGTNNQAMAEYLKKSGIGFEVFEHWETPAELTGKLDNFDLVFRTPGLPYLSEAIQQAKTKGVEVSSQTKLFFDLSPAPIVAVTGTKGKGTTSSLIAAILSASGKKVFLAGNIGRDPFQFLDQISPDSFVVMELSSFQVQDLSKSPHVGVVLAITPDHLDHHKDFEEYSQAKANLLIYQGPQDFAILDESLPEKFQELGAGQKIIFRASDAAKLKTKLLGLHNRENIAAAVAVARVLGLEEEAINRAVADFEPLPHRLQPIGIRDQITYIDDSFSTNIESTIAAIEAVPQDLVLILGGSDKGLDFSLLGEFISRSPKVQALVVIGKVTPKILSSLQNFKGKILTGATSMPEILDQANSLAAPGMSVLLSPATASFDMFQNATDRGEQFRAEISRL